jgi:hypothetical protein
MSDLLISSDAWQRLNEAATSVAASVDKHYGSHAAGVSKGWDDALAAVGRNLRPAAISQPSGEACLPQGWRVEPMDAPADRLLVTSRDGAAVVIGPDSWKQTLGSHVLYSLIRDLAAAPQPKAVGGADTERLDWLMNNCGTLGTDGYGNWWVYLDWCKTRVPEHGCPTQRDAIDDAIRQETPPATEGADHE